MKNSKYWCPKCHKYQGEDIIYEDDLMKECVISKNQGKSKFSYNLSTCIIYLKYSFKSYLKHIYNQYFKLNVKNII